MVSPHLPIAHFFNKHLRLSVVLHLDAHALAHRVLEHPAPIRQRRRAPLIAGDELAGACSAACSSVKTTCAATTDASIEGHASVGVRMVVIGKVGRIGLAGRRSGGRRGALARWWEVGALVAEDHHAEWRLNHNVRCL